MVVKTTRDKWLYPAAWHSPHREPCLPSSAPATFANGLRQKVSAWAPKHFGFPDERKDTQVVSPPFSCLRFSRHLVTEKLQAWERALGRSKTQNKQTKNNDKKKLTQDSLDIRNITPTFDDQGRQIKNTKLTTIASFSVYSYKHNLSGHSLTH